MAHVVLTDLQIHATGKGTFRTVTDLDVVAIGPPTLSGPVHYHGAQGAAECLVAGEVNPALGAEHRGVKISNKADQPDNLERRPYSGPKRPVFQNARLQ